MLKIASNHSVTMPSALLTEDTFSKLTPIWVKRGEDLG